MNWFQQMVLWAALPLSIMLVFATVQVIWALAKAPEDVD
jgi:hypothetical protein